MSNHITDPHPVSLVIWNYFQLLEFFVGVLGVGEGCRREHNGESTPTTNNILNKKGYISQITHKTVISIGIISYLFFFNIKKLYCLQVNNLIYYFAFHLICGTSRLKYIQSRIHKMWITHTIHF